jgi:hypothetical protein
MTVTGPAAGTTIGLEAIQVTGTTEPGANTINVTATGAAGNEATATRRVSRTVGLYLPWVG